MDSINNASSLGGDAWLELQAFKTRQINRRERLNRHKDLINGITTNPVYPQQSTNGPSSSQQSTSDNDLAHRKLTSNLDDSFPSNNNLHFVNETNSQIEDDDSSRKSSFLINTSANLSNAHGTITILNSPQAVSNETNTSRGSDFKLNNFNLETVECLLLLKLCDVALKLPIDSRSLQRTICRVKGLENTSQSMIENLLEKFAHQELITIEEPSTAIINRRKNSKNLDDDQDDETCIYVISADHTKLVEFDRTFGSSDNVRALLAETRTDELNTDELRSLNTNEQNSVPIQTIRNSVIQSNSLNEFKDRNDNFSDQTSKQINQSGPDNAKDSRYKLSSHFKKPSADDDLESLLSLSSTREKESKKLGEELLELLSKPTAKERNLLESFRSADGYRVQEFCPRGTKDECRRYSKETEACGKLHFKKIIAKHTEESLGDCSFLNTCFHMDSCKYVHYEVDYDYKQTISNNTRQQSQTNSGRSSIVKYNNDTQTNFTSTNNRPTERCKGSNELETTKISLIQATSTIGVPGVSSEFTVSVEDRARIEARNRKRFKTVLYPPQWIQCDLRYFDMSLLGKFSVIMADPPWDIHMELPYGTMSDDEMRKLNIPTLQDEGVIFLWVTGRAMELGRECLALWGYERCDEIIWVKTNQLQRIIRTGRTGHWLNHGKEHCLVGIKGNPTTINRGLDCDIIVAEVRATSHKPDEIYGIIERLSPGTRKIELFGRAHNVQPNWITLGNQLNGVKLVEPDLIEAFKKLDMPYHTSDEVT